MTVNRRKERAKNVNDLSSSVDGNAVSGGVLGAAIMRTKAIRHFRFER